MAKVSESGFYEKARENATWWMNLGWPNPKPDVSQCFSKNSLINIVSIATGYKSRRSDPWTEKSKILASHGDYCFFDGLLDADANAHRIVAKLLKQCDDDDEAYLTVLPLAYYHNEHFYEFPVFRFSRFRNSNHYYMTIDCMVYESIEILVNNFPFPGQIIAYPKVGRLVPKSETDPEVDMCFYKPKKPVGFKGIVDRFRHNAYSQWLGKDVLSRPWDDLRLKTYTNKYSDSEYNTIAVENMTRYLHRGGHNQGDVPQFIEGVDLYNIIGYSMGIMPQMPLEDDLKAAMNGDYCLYSGDVLKLIRHITMKIEDNCGGNKKNYITVIPIEIFCDHKLIEMPLFRFKRRENDQNKFVDSTGRVYKNFQDWRDNNKLPPGIQLFPGHDGHLKEKDSTGSVDCFHEDTPSKRAGSKILRGADMIIGLAGLGATLATLFTGGLALPLIAVGSAVYGTIRCVGTVIDRGQHDESLNPITDNEARMLWLSIIANLLSFGSMGATMGLTLLAAKGHTFTATFCTIVNIANGSAVTANTVAILNTTIYMFANWENMGPDDWAMQLMSIAFWAKGTFRFKTASTMIRETRALMLDGFTRQLQGQQLENFMNFRGGIHDDAFLIKFLQFHANAGRSPEVVVHYLSQLQSVASELNVPYHVGTDGRVVINHQQVPLDLIFNLPPNQREGFTFILGLSNQEQLIQFNDQTAPAIGSSSFRFGETNPGQIIIGKGHVFNLHELLYFNKPIVKMIMTDFNSMDSEQVISFNLIRNTIPDNKLLPWINENNEWIQNLIPRITKLQSTSNLFLSITVKLMENGDMLLKELILLPFDRVENIVAANNNLIKYNNFIKLLKVLPEDLSSKRLESLSEDIVKSFRYFRREFKINFEFHLQEAFDWFVEITNTCIDKDSDFGKISNRDQITSTQHQNRLFGIQVRANEFKTVAPQIVKFACLMKPERVIEFGHYIEFACTYFKFTCDEAEFPVKQFMKSNPKVNNALIKQKFNLTGKTFKDSYREKAKLEVFGNSGEDLMEKFKSFKSITDKYMDIAEPMWGNLTLPDNIDQMDEAGIIAFIRHPDNVVKYGSQLGAACHVYKKELTNPSQHIKLANDLIKNDKSTLKVIVYRKKFELTFENNSAKAQVNKYPSRDINLVTFTPNLVDQ